MMRKSGKRPLTTEDYEILDEVRDILLSKDEVAIAKLHRIIKIPRTIHKLPEDLQYGRIYDRDGVIRGAVIGGGRAKQA